MTLTITLRRSSVVGCLAAALMSPACSASTPSAVPRPRQIVHLNQGWSEREAQFYNHANDGTNLAPLEFVLNLPDPAARGSRFVDRLADYGFIASAKSPSNPHGLPVGFAIDDRPASFGDRAYVGITCSACHTRQLTYSKVDSSGQPLTWILPVHGGPGLVDIRASHATCTTRFSPCSTTARWRMRLRGAFSVERRARRRSRPPEQRPKTFRTGSSELDVEGVGLRSDGPFVYDTAEPGKGNGGHLFGTDLPREKKGALIEYLKSL